MATGAVPTENLPSRSHESKPKTRRHLVRQDTAEACSTSAGSPPIEMTSADLISDESLEEFASKLKEKIPDSWINTTCNNTEIRMELWDSNYSIPKYILHVDSGLQFSLHVYNWLLPDIHPLYTTHRRQMDSARVVDFLEAIRDGKYVICEGLRQDEHVQSIAKDPDDASHTSFSNSDVIRHSIPNKVEMDSNFGVLVVFRCVDCELLLGRNVDEEQVICDPCKKLQKNILVQQNRKKRCSSAPAKAKAPLTACSSEKLRATVVATRLECKQLEDKIKNLQNKIE